MKCIVTVIGRDRVGIISTVCAALSAKNANILDINQTVMQEYLTMMMLVDASEINVPFTELADSLEQTGRENGLSIRIQREDIFEAMHRI